MQCKCFLIQLLAGKIDGLKKILEMSDTVNTYDSSCQTAMSNVKSESWNATESEELEIDTQILLTMTDKLQTAHTSVVDAINKALEQLNKEYDEAVKEDEEYQKAEAEKAMIAK